MTYDPLLKFQKFEALEFRELVVNYLREFIDTKHIFWDTETRGPILHRQIDMGRLPRELLRLLP